MDRMGRLEELVRRAERLGDHTARDLARELVQALLEVHGEGFKRIFAAAGSPPALVAACQQDELLASLLMLHGLHPEPLEERVERALAKVRPVLERHSGDVELVSLEGDVAHLRLLGACQGCPSSTETLRRHVEEALYEEAPDLAGYEVEMPPAPAPMKLVSASPERSPVGPEPVRPPREPR